MVLKMNSSSSSLDPIPASLLKACFAAIAPTETYIINKSLTAGEVAPSLKLAAIKPVLKKHNLDPEVLSHYRPISNLPFLAKVLEKVVILQLQWPSPLPPALRNFPVWFQTIPQYWNCSGEGGKLPPNGCRLWLPQLINLAGFKCSVWYSGPWHPALAPPGGGNYRNCPGFFPFRPHRKTGICRSGKFHLRYQLCHLWRPPGVSLGTRCSSSSTCCPWEKYWGDITSDSTPMQMTRKSTYKLHLTNTLHYPGLLNAWMTLIIGWATTPCC